jgi:hypothetical protein
VHGADAPGEAARFGGCLALRGHRGFDVDHDHVAAVCMVDGHEPACSGRDVDNQAFPAREQPLQEREVITCREFAAVERCPAPVAAHPLNPAS